LDHCAEGSAGRLDASATARLIPVRLTALREALTAAGFGITGQQQQEKQQQKQAGGAQGAGGADVCLVRLLVEALQEVLCREGSCSLVCVLFHTGKTRSLHLQLIRLLVSLLCTTATPIHRFPLYCTTLTTPHATPSLPPTHTHNNNHADVLSEVVAAQQQDTLDVEGALPAYTALKHKLSAGGVLAAPSSGIDAGVPLWGGLSEAQVCVCTCDCVGEVGRADGRRAGIHVLVSARVQGEEASQGQVPDGRQGCLSAHKGACRLPLSRLQKWVCFSFYLE
jgi:hypothetical protein